MSRGRGRGGFGRGGAYGAGGKQLIGGQEVSWEYDPDLEVQTEPQEMFPHISLPDLPPPTVAEKAAVARFLDVSRRFRAGPLYTVLGPTTASLRGGKARAAAEFNPFEDMPTYTQKYRVGVRKLPRFEGRRYQLQFFPEELWDTIDPALAAKQPKPVPKPRSKPRAQATGGDAEKSAEEDEQQTLQKKLDNAENNVDDDADGEDGNENDQAEENPEDDFSEDDSEMGGDYNAENYFDAGDADDDMGDADGGDDGGMD